MCTRKACNRDLCIIILFYAEFHILSKEYCLMWVGSTVFLWEQQLCNFEPCCAVRSLVVWVWEADYSYSIRCFTVHLQEQHFCCWVKNSFAVQQDTEPLIWKELKTQIHLQRKKQTACFHPGHPVLWLILWQTVTVWCSNKGN